MWAHIVRAAIDGTEEKEKPDKGAGQARGHRHASTLSLGAQHSSHLSLPEAKLPRVSNYGGNTAFHTQEN